MIPFERSGHVRYKYIINVIQVGISSVGFVRTSNQSESRRLGEHDSSNPLHTKITNRVSGCDIDMRSASPAVASTPNPGVLRLHYWAPFALERKTRQCLQIGPNLVWERKYKDPLLRANRLNYKVSDYQVAI